MSFRKKVLYYGLLLLLTFLVIEGMARIAYYAAYGAGYGGGPGATDSITPPPINGETPVKFEPWMIRHPYYGFIARRPDHALNAMPPRQGRADTAVIGLLGGSVADEVQPFLQRELNRYFAADDRARQPVIRNLTLRGSKQPQQVMILVNALLLGGHFDLIVNLDGRNEIVLSAHQGISDGVFPFFPNAWEHRVGLTGEELLLTGSIGLLGREQARLAAAGETSLLRGSALFGLANRWRQERIAAEILRLNRQLAATESAYRLEKFGPRNWRQEEPELLPAVARLWYRSSVMLARLAELGGAEYYHFLQPNQYTPGAKPFTGEELAFAYDLRSPDKPFVAGGYPRLARYERELQNRGVNYFDLTGIFAANRDTLYRDGCCHLNDRGNKLLAAAMAQRLEPALRRLGGKSRTRRLPP